MKKSIAILAGDGIGPEVMQQALRVLDAIAARYAHSFEYHFADIGGAAYEKYQQHCPRETLDICEKSDAILFGSVGGPLEQQQLPKWNRCEAASILTLRQHFNFNINIRPIHIFPNLIPISPLKNSFIQHGLDIVFFRELCGDSYFGKHERFERNQIKYATDEASYNEEQIQSIATAAFEEAKLRRKKLVSVDKANVLATSKLWREIVADVGSNYPDVALSHMLVDNCAMQLVLNPTQFDVILTSNLFGDILSDLGAALTGSVGLIPSASLNKKGRGLFEPSGGSAPDITGKNVANPIAQILSAAMLLKYAFAMKAEATLIETAVRDTYRPEL